MQAVPIQDLYMLQCKAGQLRQHGWGRLLAMSPLKLGSTAALLDTSQGTAPSPACAAIAQARGGQAGGLPCHL